MKNLQSVIFKIRGIYKIVITRLSQQCRENEYTTTIPVRETKETIMKRTTPHSQP